MIRARKRRRSKRAEQVDVDGVRASIYPTPSRGHEGWTVSYRFAGRRVRKWFSELSDARSHAETQAGRIALGKTTALEASPSDLAAYQRALELLKPTGQPIELVAAEFVRTWRERARLPAKTVEDVVGEFLADRRASAAQRGRSTAVRYVEGLAFILARFREAFRMPLAAVTADQVQAWLVGLDAAAGGALGLRSRHNYFAAVRALFRFAGRRRYLSREAAQLDGIQLAAAGPGRVQVYSPEELMRILQCAAQEKPQFVPFLAVQAFTGIRTEEMTRLRDTDLHLKTGWVVLSADITKTSRRRLVPIAPALKRWLRAFRLPKGLLAPTTAGTITGRLCELVTAAGVETRHNGLRDSRITYRMALLQDAARVADESGNSPAMIARSYREVALRDGRIVTPDLGAAWFAVEPDGRRSKIVPLRGAA